MSLYDTVIQASELSRGPTWGFIPAMVLLFLGIIGIGMSDSERTPTKRSVVSIVAMGAIMASALGIVLSVIFFVDGRGNNLDATSDTVDRVFSQVEKDYAIEDIVKVVPEEETGVEDDNKVWLQALAADDVADRAQVIVTTEDGQEALYAVTFEGKDEVVLSIPSSHAPLDPETLRR